MASNSYTLEVIANTAKYQQELARIPGLTEKQAAAAALKMASAQEKAQQKMAADAEKYAKQAAEAQEAAFDEATRAAEQAAERQNEAADHAADGFGKVGSSASKLGGVLEMLGIEGASTIADLADAGEVAAEAFGGLSSVLGGASAIIGPLAAAVGLVAGSFWVLASAAGATSEKVELSADSLERFNKAQEAVKAAQSGTVKTFQDAQVQVGLLTGQLEDYEVAAYNASESVRAGAAPQIKAYEETGAALQDQLDQLQAKLDAQEYDRNSLDDIYIQQNKLKAQYDENAAALSALTAETDKNANKLFDAIYTAGQKGKADGKATESAKAHTAAVKEDTAALAAQAAALANLAQIEATAVRGMQTAAAQQQAALADQLKAIDQLEAASGDSVDAATARAAVQAKYAKDADIYALQQVAALQSLTDAQTENLRSAEEVAAAKLQLDLDAIDRQANMAAEALRLAGATEAQITAIYQQAATARQAAEENASQQRQKEAEAEAEKTKKTVLEMASDVAAQAASISDSYLTLMTNVVGKTEDALEEARSNGDYLEEQSLKRRLKKQKEAALKGYRIQQAANIAGATASTIKGSIDAFTSVFETVPYPVNLVLAPATAAAVAAAGAVQIASLASSPPPSFRTGGIIPSNAPPLPGGYQDQRLVSAEPGERIYSKQESAAIDRMLAGGGGPVVIQQVYRGRVVGEVVADELQRAGRLRAVLGSRNSARSNPYAR